MNSEYQIQMDLINLNLNKENKNFNYGFNNYNYYYNFNNNNTNRHRVNTLNYLSKFDNKINGNYYMKNNDNSNINSNNNNNNYINGNLNQNANGNSNDTNNNSNNNGNENANGNGFKNRNNYMNNNNNNKNNYFPKRNFNGNIANGKKKYFNDNNNKTNNDNNYNNNNNHNNNQSHNQKYYNNNNGKLNNFYYNNNNNNNNNKYFQHKKKTFTYKLRWDGYDPFTIKSLIFRAETYIANRYPNLAILNNKNENEGFSNKITNKSKYFIIKSFNEEDVHKAIKYSLWCSTNSGNQTLNEAFRKTKEEGGEVYLFFSCNGSGRYIGMARMINEFNEKKQFNYWTQDSKWKGFFDIEWIYVKDIPFKCFKMINIIMK